VFTEHRPGSFCFISPGDLVWKSDLDALRQIVSGSSAQLTANAVVAKYLINKESENR
jgi:hypothetical protein